MLPRRRPPPENTPDQDFQIIIRLLEDQKEANRRLLAVIADLTKENPALLKSGVIRKNPLIRLIVPVEAPPVGELGAAHAGASLLFADTNGEYFRLCGSAAKAL